MNLFDEIFRNEKLLPALAVYWRQLIGDPVPEIHQFAIWLSRYDMDLICRAVSATAMKRQSARAGGQDMTLNHLQRYVSATMRNTAAERQAVPRG